MLSLISLLLHLYVAARLLPALASWPAACILLIAVLIATAWLMPMGIGLRWRRQTFRRGASDTLSALGWIGMGFFSSLLVLTFLRDLLLFGVSVADLVVPGIADRAAWRLDSGVAVPLAALAISLYGYARARRTAPVVAVDVPIANLPPALDGFRIAQISDIHVGPTIRRPYLERIVGAVNRLQADMVAITGDLVDGSVDELATHVAPLADLSSRHGSYFVTGNHEYYSGAPAWIAELRRLGVHVLLNEHVVLRHGAGGKLGGSEALAVVAGVTDFGAGRFDPAHRSDPAKAIVGAPREAGVRVLLAHQPRSAEAAADAGFDLQLSGHTHGGQFLPWTFFVRLQQPFVAGLHRLRGLWIYISRGTGYWGPPKRFGAPPEITLLRLRAG